MNEALLVIAEPVRRRMLDLLRDGERSAGEFERALNVKQPTASRHLRALREAGLVRVRKDAQRRVYTLDPTRLAELDAWLSTYRHFWTSALDGLARHLDREV